MRSDCERARKNALSYWLTSPDLRPSVFHELEEHVMKCDSCAAYLEELATGKD